jgi:hypothetical protein
LAPHVTAGRQVYAAAVPTRASPCSWPHKIMEAPRGLLLHTLQLPLVSSISFSQSMGKQVPAEHSLGTDDTKLHFWNETFKAFSQSLLLFAAWITTHRLIHPWSPLPLLPQALRPDTLGLSHSSEWSSPFPLVQAQDARMQGLISWWELNLVILATGWMPWSILIVNPHGKYLLISWKLCGVESREGAEPSWGRVVSGGCWSKKIKEIGRYDAAKIKEARGQPRSVQWPYGHRQCWTWDI